MCSAVADSEVLLGEGVGSMCCGTAAAHLSGLLSFLTGEGVGSMCCGTAAAHLSGLLLFEGGGVGSMCCGSGDAHSSLLLLVASSVCVAAIAVASSKVSSILYPVARFTDLLLFCEGGGVGSMCCLSSKVSSQFIFVAHWELIMLVLLRSASGESDELLKTSCLAVAQGGLAKV